MLTFVSSYLPLPPIGCFCLPFACHFLSLYQPELSQLFVLLHVFLIFSLKCFLTHLLYITAWLYRIKWLNISLFNNSVNASPWFLSYFHYCCVDAMLEYYWIIYCWQCHWWCKWNTIYGKICIISAALPLLHTNTVLAGAAVPLCCLAATQVKSSQSAKKAASLRAKFEKWESEVERNNEYNQSIDRYEDEEECMPSIDTARNLRAMFENKAQEVTRPATDRPKVKVNRFVVSTPNVSGTFI